MKKLRIYLDTSVISYLEQEDAPERMQETRELWEKIIADEYEIIVSEMAMMELNRCDDVKKEKLYGHLNKIKYEKGDITKETFRLANKIIEMGILTRKSFDDCQHIALAFETGCDCILSWNFKHIVNLKTMRGVRAISSIEGYKEVQIVTPSVLLEREWIRFEKIRDQS